MEIFHDYQNCAILYVDDEEMSLKYFTRAFGNKFRVFSAANASEGYRLLEATSTRDRTSDDGPAHAGRKGSAILGASPSTASAGDSYSDDCLLRSRCCHRGGQLGSHL